MYLVCVLEGGGKVSLVVTRRGHKIFTALYNFYARLLPFKTRWWGGKVWT